MSPVGIVSLGLITVAGNQLLGCLVLAFIDRDGQLLKWVRQAPHWVLKGAVVQLWPVVLWMYFRKGEQ